MIRGFPMEKARNPIVTLRPASKFNVMILTVSHFWVFNLRKCRTVVNFIAWSRWKCRTVVDFNAGVGESVELLHVFSCWRLFTWRQRNIFFHYKPPHGGRSVILGCGWSVRVPFQQEFRSIDFPSSNGEAFSSNVCGSDAVSSTSGWPCLIQKLMHTGSCFQARKPVTR